MTSNSTENRGPQVAGTAGLFIALTWIAVSLRVYVRTMKVKSFGVDDWLAVASLAAFTCYVTFVFKGVQYGTGQHLANLPLENIPIALRWWWCCEIAYVLASMLLKFSIGVFLMRIAVKPVQIYIIWAVMSVVGVFSIFYVFLIIFQCHPVAYFWAQYTGLKGSCVDPSIIADSTYAHSAISCFADWTLGTLPIFMVWHLAMNPRTKLSVAMILALGAIGSTATIVRIPYISQLTETSDFLFSTTDVAIWSTVEPGIGITAAAIATLRPLFRTFLSRNKLMGSTTEGSEGWSKRSKPTRLGYLRSTDTTNVSEELGLRTDIGKGAGITTTIKGQVTDPNNHDKSHRDTEPVSNNATSGHSRAGSQRGLRSSAAGWELDSRLADDSSDDYQPVPPSWGYGIKKTTEISTRESKSGRPPVPGH